MHLADRYELVALTADGTLLDHTDGDLTGAALVSFVPKQKGLPRHDVTGLRFKRRFGRGFIRAHQGSLVEYAHCVVTTCSRIYVRCSDGTCLVAPYDYELYI